MKTSRRNMNTHRYTSCSVFLASELAGEGEDESKDTKKEHAGSVYKTN